MQNAAYQFQLGGAPISCEPYGRGHINETYIIKTDAGRPYILQRINGRVFHDIPGLMGNVARVTRYLAEIDPDPRHALTLIPAAGGGDYWQDDDGGIWRVYHYISNSICLQAAENAEDFRQSGVAFGRFQRLLSGFPAETLAETIPRFHDTPYRFEQFKRAMAEDAAGRARQVAEEIGLSLSYEKEAGGLMEMLREGRLPLRVAHNDTKLNNVLLDADTREPLCVVDLDTIMPGLAANDFGDSIRFGASTAAEDEADLDMVMLSLPYFEAYTKGFLSECGGNLTDGEVASLPLGAKLMTLECGVRFLADYLNGDQYFRVARPGHNLDRARTQLKLVAEMERNWERLCDIVERTRGSVRG